MTTRISNKLSVTNLIKDTKLIKKSLTFDNTICVCVCVSSVCVREIRKSRVLK